MRKNPAKIIHKFRTLESERKSLLKVLLSSKAVCKGSLSKILGRCGKPTCHCATQPGHEVWILNSSTGNGRRCQAIRKADVTKVRKLAQTYKAFRAARKRFLAIQKAQTDILRGLIEERNVPYE